MFCSICKYNTNLFFLGFLLACFWGRRRGRCSKVVEYVGQSIARGPVVRDLVRLCEARSVSLAHSDGLHGIRDRATFAGSGPAPHHGPGARVLHHVVGKRTSNITPCYQRRNTVMRMRAAVNYRQSVVTCFFLLFSLSCIFFFLTATNAKVFAKIYICEATFEIIHTNY